MKVNYFNMGIADTCQYVAVEVEGYPYFEIMIPHYQVNLIDIEELIAIKLKQTYGIEASFEFNSLVKQVEISLSENN